MHTVLIVDDDPVVRNLLKDICEAKGAHPVLAPSAEHALELMAGVDFHLIITDIVMPGMRGDEFISILKKQPRHQTIPILVISGHAGDDVVLKYIRLGAEDVLEKPFVLELLDARIVSCLEKYELRKLSKEAEKIRQRDKLTKEMVGTICHNFNQPLTHVGASLHLLKQYAKLLSGHCNFVHGKYSADEEEKFRERSTCYFATKKKDLSREALHGHILEEIASLEEAARNMTKLVNKVESIMRPVSEAYVQDACIIGLESSSRYTILVADDDMEVVNLIRKGLEGEAVDLIVATSGKEAERHARFSCPHAMILDVHMPEMESILEIFRLRHTKQVVFPLIVLSADSDPSNGTILPEHFASVDAFIPKSDEGAIAKTISMAINFARKHSKDLDDLILGSLDMPGCKPTNSAGK